MEAEIVLGVLYREGGTPKKGGTLASPQIEKEKPRLGRGIGGMGSAKFAPQKCVKKGPEKRPESLA